MIKGKNALLLMDSSLEGQFENEDATKLVDLASKCLQNEAKDRPDTKFLLSSVAPLQKQKEVRESLLKYVFLTTKLISFVCVLGCISCLDGSAKEYCDTTNSAFSSRKGLFSVGP